MEKKIKIGLITIVVGIVLISGWFILNKLLLEAGVIDDEKYCQQDSDCVLAYIGMDPCAPCDFSDSSHQCVSPEYAEKIHQERIKKHGRVLCEPCYMSPFWFRCICKENKCFKISECKKDADCYSKTFEDQYKCIDNKCTYPID